MRESVCGQMTSYLCMNLLVFTNRGVLCSNFNSDICNYEIKHIKTS